MSEEEEIDILREAVTLGKLLGQLDITWAFIGGVAVGIHGYIRATEDIDIILNISDLDKLDTILKDQGYIIHKDSINFEDGFRLFRRVKIIGEEYFVLDALVPPEEFNFLFENRFEGLLDETKIFVISKENLLWLKKHTGRKIDLADAEALEKDDE